MTIINFTPHTVDVYAAECFENLEQLDATTWVADGVNGAPLVSLRSEGKARVKVGVIQSTHVDGIPTVTSVYGALEGLPDYQDGVFYVVSLPTVSGAIANGRTTADLLTPYQVVRSRANGSLVLGCMGFSRQ